MVEPKGEDLAFQREFEQAEIAATQANLTEPRVVSAYYDLDSAYSPFNSMAAKCSCNS